MNEQFFTLKLDQIEKEEFCTQFCIDGLKGQGFCILETPFLQSQLKKLKEELESFFSHLEIEDKLSLKYSDSKELGYLNDIESGKEFLAFRNSSSLSDFFSSSFLEKNSKLVDLTVRLWESMDQLAKQLLSVLARHLQVEPSKLLELCEPCNPNNRFSQSMLHLFHYSENGPFASDLSCRSHTDSGFLTLIPTASSAGLECLNWNKSQFIDCESHFEFGSHVVVLVGETLARLTCSYFPATVHQVRFRKSPRFSFPFQLRATPSAILDSVALNSPLIKVPKSLQKKIMISDFIQ